MMTKAKAWEVTDEFWKRVEPLLPVRQRAAEQTGVDPI
jgi:transposase